MSAIGAADCFSLIMWENANDSGCTQRFKWAEVGLALHLRVAIVSKAPQAFGHIHALDGIRGFAVFLVFTYHVLFFVVTSDNFAEGLLKKIVTSGWVGVDLFFVLSGFLITTILLDAKPARNYYKVFYIRRGLRIFPLYYLVLAASLALEPGHYAWRWKVFYWLNLSNLPTAFVPLVIPFLAHFWSLAIEEQFYMVWPSIVRWLRPRALAWLCVVVIVTLFLARNLPVVLRWNLRWPELVYRLTPFRVDTLCGGALLALIVKYRPALVADHRTWLRSLFLASLLVFVLSGQLYTEPYVIRFGYTALVIGLGSLVALALTPGTRTARIFSNAFLRQLGKYSYSFYLFHPYVVNAVASNRSFILRGFRDSGPLLATPTHGMLLLFPLEFGTVFALSALSWTVLEGPVLKLKRHFRYEPAPEHYLA